MYTFFCPLPLREMFTVTIALYALTYFIDILRSTKRPKFVKNLVVFLYLFGLFFFIMMQFHTILVWPDLDLPSPYHVGIVTKSWGIFFIPYLGYIVDFDVDVLFIIGVFFLHQSIRLVKVIGDVVYYLLYVFLIFLPLGFCLIRVICYSIFLWLPEFFYYLQFNKNELILFYITVLFIFCCFMGWF